MMENKQPEKEGNFMDEKKAIERVLRISRINNMIIGILLLATIGFFFYGLVNSIAAKKEKELALQNIIKLKECEKKAEELNQQLVLSLEEARKAKDYALVQAEIASDLSQKASSKK